MRILISSLAGLAVMALHAQGKIETVKNDSGTFVLHRFTTGELSSKEWTDKDGRWGRSWAYDRQGHVIYEQQTRRFAGHASVDFRYHPNGAVSRADYSTMPDGGIQWYKSTTTFDENGKQTGFSEEGWDNYGPIRPHAVRPSTPSYEQREVYEQQMFKSEYLVVADRRCHVGLQPKAQSPAAPQVDAIMAKGDTLYGGYYSIGESWDDPLKHVEVSATSRNGKRKYQVVRTDMVQVSPDHRRYYFIVGKKR
ncbi:MAG: hypothetical protein J5I62_00560 [Flavobacteriales bacterium]|nr:hypothetical protein [Flavobacteriales bacterium]MEB2342435.1 hypothetical protein [Flavobacteriia bacterium]